MNDTIVRYQHYPLLIDTVGFFDVCIPLTNESNLQIVDSLSKYYDLNSYNYISPGATPRQQLQIKSIYTPHQLKPIHSSPLSINKQPTDWITIVLLMCLVIFTWIQVLYPKRLSQIFRACAQPHFLNQLEREGNLFKERIRLGLGFIYFSCSSIFLFLLSKEFGLAPTGMSSYFFTLLIFTGLLLFEAAKTVAVYMLGIIFNTSENARQYQLNTMIFNHIIGLSLIPIITMAFYWNNSIIIFIGIIFISLLILYRIFRGILTGLSGNKYNLFYLFLYLCTLEILPLLLLSKALILG
jgi:hypothetical protein